MRKTGNASAEQKIKVPHTIKFSSNTNVVLERMRNTYAPVKSFNNMVETLVENHPDFIKTSKKKK